MPNADTPVSPEEPPEQQIERLRAELEDEKRRRKRAENEQRCFRELAENIREVFWMTNPLGDELVYISPAYEHIWGQTCRSLYNDPGRRLAWVHDNDRQRVLTAFKRDAADGNYDETFRIERPDGEIRWIRDRAFPVSDQHGQLYRVAGFALDVTHTVETNDRMARLHGAIDGRERASVFAALGTGLAHDISQPLTAARNFLASVRMNLADNENDGHASLERADSEIERAVSIIRHLRDFAREGKPTRENVALFPLIDDVRQLMDPALRAAGIRYYGPAPEQLHDLEMPLDRVFAQQILRNLIANAIDAFSDRTEGPRDLGVSVNLDHDEYVDVEVSDSGPGIAQDSDPFESFHTTKEHGLGLGLAVSRTLARSHGGDLLLADRGDFTDGCQDNSRTRFVLRLPRIATDNACS